MGNIRYEYRWVESPKSDGSRTERGVEYLNELAEDGFHVVPGIITQGSMGTPAYILMEREAFQ